jgi:hypothetical protein
MLDEFAAVKTALSAGALSGKVFDTARRDNTGALVREAYAILYGGAPDRLSDERFTAAQRPESRATYVYTVRAVAPDADGVRYVMSKAITNLVGVRLAIAGRVCNPITLELGNDVQQDDSVPDSLYFMDAEFQLISAPA